MRAISTRTITNLILMADLLSRGRSGSCDSRGELGSKDCKAERIVLSKEVSSPPVSVLEKRSTLGTIGYHVTHMSCDLQKGEGSPLRFVLGVMCH